MILTADLHLDDRAENSYRWAVLDALIDNAEQGSTVAILGDLTDDRGRFSALLVNRMVERLVTLTQCGVQVRILQGNHDAPLSGPSFWGFLNTIPGIAYIAGDPVLEEGGRLFVPYQADPALLAGFLKGPYDQERVVFLHQLITGAKVRGRALEGISTSILPSSLPTYAGDIHAPQKVGPVTYVGAPHPVDFGDDHRCRLLVLDDKSFAIKREIKLTPIRKLIAEIDTAGALDRLDLRAGDQVKIRFTMPAEDTARWPAHAAAIAAWAERVGVTVSGTEVALNTAETKAVFDADLDSPADLLAAFAKVEGIEGDLLKAGEVLLGKASRR